MSNSALPPSGGAPGRSRRAPLQRLFAALAGLLAVAGLVSLAAILLGALNGTEVWPGFAAGAIYALPAAFILMGVLVIDGIRRRRRS